MIYKLNWYKTILQQTSLEIVMKIKIYWLEVYGEVTAGYGNKTTLPVTETVKGLKES